MSTKASREVARIRRTLPQGYEILPVEVIRHMVRAAHIAFFETGVEELRQAGRAAANVLRRRQALDIELALLARMRKSIAEAGERIKAMGMEPASTVEIERKMGCDVEGKR